MRNAKKSHRLILYAIRARQWILENTDFGCFEGEHHEENGDDAEQGNRELWMVTRDLSLVELTSLVKIRNRRRDKKDRNVDPIGRSADCSVVGVKNDGDQHKSEKDSTKLYA